MHPPLFQAHPLCREEVETLVRCHEERSVAKFFNACGPAKLALDACFREEKVLRKRLNHRVPEDLPPMLRRGSTEGSVEGAGGSARSS